MPPPQQARHASWRWRWTLHMRSVGGPTSSVPTWSPASSWWLGGRCCGAAAEAAGARWQVGRGAQPLRKGLRPAWAGGVGAAALRAAAAASQQPLCPCNCRLPAGTLGELLLTQAGASAWVNMAIFPLGFLLLRLVAGWLLPLLSAPLLWPLRRAVWQPAWWLDLPLAVACFLASGEAEERGTGVFAGVYAGVWSQACVLALSW